MSRRLVPPGLTTDDPRHGTYAGWQAHLKTGVPACDPCRHAQYLYTKRMRLKLATQGPERGDLGEVAWQIIGSMGRRELSRLTGLRDSYLSRLHGRGPSARVYRRTRDTILAARRAPTPAGIQRRARALHALGYTGAALAREVGISVDAMRQLLRAPEPRRYHHVEVTTAVVAVYDRLAWLPMPPGAPATAARNRARARGWAPPLAWDDIDHDEHPWQPAPQPAGRPEVLSSILAEYDHLTTGGVPAHQAAARLGVTLDTIRDYRTRAARRERVA